MRQTNPFTGKIPFKMTNDFIFKVLLQDKENIDILKALVCASLRTLQIEDIQELTVLNPIELTNHFDTKTMILDIKALMNDQTIINLEMQVINNHDWPERSVSYLCRAFDNMTKGEHYIDKKGAYHIGFLDYPLFEDAPEFCADYRIANAKTGHIYTGKFGLTVIDLTHIDLATEEDILNHLDLWASFFKAKTWEEMDMLAQKDTSIAKAVSCVKTLTEDERIRMYAEAREDQIKQQNDMKLYYQEQLDECNEKLARAENEIVEKDLLISKLQAELRTKSVEND